MKRPPALTDAVKRGFAPFRGERAAQLVPRSRLTGPMPWVMAIMVTLTIIAAAGGLALSNLTQGARADLAGSATVQIVEADLATRRQLAERASDILAQNREVASIRIVPEDELEALLEPWLGSGYSAEAVPVPALIDVKLRSGAGEGALRELENALVSEIPNARIDAQSSWLQPVFGAIRSLQWLAAALVILLGATSAAAVWLAARTALGTNRATIEVVHLLGGSDSQIARIFQRSIAFDAIAGGIAGLALGCAAVLFFARRFAQLESGMVSAGGLGPVDWFFIAAIPLAGVLIATLTARFTVLGALRRML